MGYDGPLLLVSPFLGLKRPTYIANPCTQQVNDENDNPEVCSGINLMRDLSIPESLCRVICLWLIIYLVLDSERKS